MKLTRSLRFFLCALICLPWLTACSGDEPGASPSAAAPTAALSEPEIPEIPEIVVLHGSEELIPFLEAEGWWGEIDPDNPPSVPRLIVTRVNPEWRETSQSLPVQHKKALFYRLMLPLVMHANTMALDFREGLKAAQDEWENEGELSADSLVLLHRLAPLLPGMTVEEAQALSADEPNMAEMLDTLIYRVDAVPAGLALGQAAYESGYGTSRFATEGNSLFGQWTYGGDGIKPEQQRTDSKGDHRIKAFEWPFDSVRGYFINLMTHPAYEDFRRLRAEARAEGRPLDTLELADGLIRYSERGQDYVDSLKGIIRHNHLYLADRFEFRDEPIRFLRVVPDEAQVEATKQAITEAAESGELAEIYERMRLD